MPRPLPTLLFLIPLAVADLCCSLSSEDGFIQGALLDPCDNSVPVCSKTAGCRLKPGENYIEADFPGVHNFIVNSYVESNIVLIIYFRSQEAPGSDTDIYWYEPGCWDYVSHNEAGINLFRQVGDDRVWTITGPVYREGDHLVEIRSDATAEVLIKVEVEPIE